MCDPYPKVGYMLYVAGLEISVDFYVAKAGDLDRAHVDYRRWQMVDLLRRHVMIGNELFETQFDGVRWTSAMNSNGQVLSPDVLRFQRSRANITTKLRRATSRKVMSVESYAQAPLDSTVYAGAKNKIVSYRVMDKITDRRAVDLKKLVELEKEKTRARIEITLLKELDEKGVPAVLGVEAPEDLFRFAFHNLRKTAFEFFLPTMDPDDLDAEVAIFTRAGAIGLDEYHRAKWMQYERDDEPPCAKRPLGKKAHRLLYSTLNRKVWKALKKLAKEWEYQEPRRNDSNDLC